jgi:hypothetical protein
VYAVWADDTSGNRDVLFTRSLEIGADSLTGNKESGANFERIKNLSNNTSDLFNQKIAVFGDNVYVVWVDRGEDGSTNILFRASADGGQTFGSTVNVSSNANEETLPKVGAYEGNVYIAWNVIDEASEGSENQGRFFVRSLDQRNPFGDAITLNQENNYGELQVASHNETVYVVAGGLHRSGVNRLFFATSTDSGSSFSEAVTVDENGTFVNTLNVA